MSRPGPRSTGPLLLLATALLGAADAGAQQRRVLVLPFSGDVPGAPDGARRLTQVVARAAGLTGADVSTGHAPFADAAILAGCSEETPECFAQVAAALHADQVVIGAVEPSADGATISLTVKIYMVGAIDERVLSFPASGIDGLVEAVAREAPRLFVPGGEPVVEPAPAPPEPAPAPPPPILAPAPAPTPRGDGGFRFGRVGWLPWTVLGGGVALAGAGTGFLILAGRRQEEVDALELHDVGDFERLVELEDQGARYASIGNGLMIAGGAAVIGGAVLVLLDGRSKPRPASVSFAPTPIPGGMAVNLWVRSW